MAYSLLATCQRGAFHYSLASISRNAEDSNAEDSNFEGSNPMRLGSEPAGLEFYYSFVTMTTLGYGDIVPVSSAARGLATLQAVVGQLYLAVLVARLVGLYVAESASRTHRLLRDALGTSTPTSMSVVVTGASNQTESSGKSATCRQCALPGGRRG